MTQYTMDDFLGGLVRMKQAMNGYRATSDAVLLAAAIPAKPRQSVLDVGLGTGAVSLCLGARVKDLSLTGVELQPALAELAIENAALNNIPMEIMTADITHPIPMLKKRFFDHVMTNPPYFTEDGDNKTELKTRAHKEQIPLETWIAFCLKYLKPKGTFTIIHRTDRAPEILSILQKKLGKLTLVPFWPKEDVQPKRILIQGTLGSRTPFTLHPGIVMHNDDNTRTSEVEVVMRNGKKLSF